MGVRVCQSSAPRGHLEPWGWMKAWEPEEAAKESLSPGCCRAPRPRAAKKPVSRGRGSLIKCEGCASTAAVVVEASHGEGRAAQGQQRAGSVAEGSGPVGSHLSLSPSFAKATLSSCDQACPALTCLTAVPAALPQEGLLTPPAAMFNVTFPGR